MSRAFLAAIAVVVAYPFVASAQIPSRQETEVEGGRVVSRSFKRNLFFYKDIGGGTDVQSNRRKRRWWCAWLCKTRRSMRARSIRISNTYFADVDPGPAEVLVSTTRFKECTKAASCTQREWAFLIGVGLHFDGTPAAPPGAKLPLKGVLSRHSIVLESGQRVDHVTAKGSILTSGVTLLIPPGVPALVDPMDPGRFELVEK